MTYPEKLIEKYNVPVPRYTSYPPATEFTGNMTETEYKAMLSESNRRTPHHVALYIHIPFCRQICFYCGCNANHIGSGTLVKPYMEALKREIEIVSAHIHKNREVSQIHFGGGTPNAIDASFLQEIIDLIRSKFRFIENPEIAIECHPGYLDSEYINGLRNAGFNRFSLGVQDFNNEVLKSVNRTPSAMPLDETVKMLRSSGASINLDFIYGLPGQDKKSFSETINKAISMRPDRLVTFSYAHVPWVKKHQTVLEKIGLPGPTEKTGMFTAAHDILRNAGYVFIGLDHFVLPDDELATAFAGHTLHRNFQGYCTRRTTGQVYAFGVSAISQLEGGYVQNTKDIKEYIKILENDSLPVDRGLRITQTQREIREVVNEIMCNKYLSWTEISSRLGVPKKNLLEQFVPDISRLREFSEDGLLVFSDDEIHVTERGSLFIRNIAASLDPDFHSGNNRHSRSV
jgi:oxygen-independent coproporphyrinogen-3 oxidase